MLIYQMLNGKAGYKADSHIITMRSLYFYFLAQS